LSRLQVHLANVTRTPLRGTRGRSALFRVRAHSEPEEPDEPDDPDDPDDPEPADPEELEEPEEELDVLAAFSELPPSLGLASDLLSPPFFPA
jgi:hypothetical protein